MQKNNEERYAMIEVCSKGCAHGLRLHITLNRQDTRSKFGYIKLANISLRRIVWK